MKRIVYLALLACCAWPLTSLAQESLVARKLRQMVEEQEQILAGAERSDGSYDEKTLEGRFQGLVHQFDAFIQENEDFPAGYVAYARLLEQIGKREAARVMYMQANQLDPNIPLVKNQLGNFLAEEGDFAKALPYYLAAIELEPGEPLYHYQLGQLLHEFRDEFLEADMFTRAVLDDKMLAAFREAAVLGSDQPAFSYRFAEAFYDLEEPRWTEALEAWHQVEKTAAPGIERQAIYLHRANIALKQGKPATARELLEKVRDPVLQGNKTKLESQLESAAGAELE